jgi:hypothetical protein
MDESKQRVVKFIQKEIKTYEALSLFLAKKDTKGHVRVADKKTLINSSFYKDRMKEAKRLMYELSKSN